MSTKIEWVQITSLKHPRLTDIERFHDADAKRGRFDAKLKADLVKHGLWVPLLVRADTMEVVDGRARLRTLRRLRVEMVPVVFFDFDGKDGSDKLKNLSVLIARIDARLRWSIIPGAPREAQRDLDGYHAERVKAGESVKALAKDMHRQKGKRAVALVEAAVRRGRGKKPLLRVEG